ncbi:ATP-binding protein [Streptomyces sp. NPDC059262]|uniref:ATP-binding protein n=1 Tax=Streptomyces sp. NPDC059262 TaxID=3346797 RepID=UPI0036849F90
MFIPRVLNGQPRRTPMAQHRGGSCWQALVTVAAQGAGVRTCRCFAIDVLRRWGLPEEQRDCAVLVVDELATNAMQHGHADMTLLLSLDRQFLVIAVADSGEGVPRQRPPTGLDPDEHGRGMRIVASLAQRTEVHHSDQGHKVLAALSTSATVRARRRSRVVLRRPPEATQRTSAIRPLASAAAEVARCPGMESLHAKVGTAAQDRLLRGIDPRCSEAVSDRPR